ncbi:uncharacterized protein EDB91DRAFT_631493 [Suillus paluster]|uniref:uncharacterized protein n=1 Tax=Suillus paluster TaxID=48578 RepID=UPI001B8787FF|nr:uncharacterized protein EDB91DRAFT_631493 [Suillus paluster]KAG1733589.1 hypothetical protein EDB91DRAFT_631493 [Suillus paluster]
MPTIPLKARTPLFSWPQINSNILYSYFAVASVAVVMYDWALIIGQEVELVWRQRWSLMTFLYLGVRYAGIPFTVLNLSHNLPSVEVTDAVSIIIYFVLNWMSLGVATMLNVIMICRLHAMYQRSKKILIFLVVIFLAVTIPCGVIAVMVSIHTSAEESILSGTYMCSYDLEGDVNFLSSLTWILGTVWEVLALCLALWVAIKHLRELHRPSTQWTIGDCIVVLIKTHVAYFASFLAVSCLTLSYFSPTLSDSSSEGVQIYGGILQIFWTIQMFVLGPRLILGVRDFNAKVVADSDAGTGITTIAFQERVHVTTSSGV